uniref:Choline transporter-like protein n=1 Tax=Takifugu rubripes TaxID=31033 RepID=A0A674MYX0_TAKRU
MSLAVDRQSLYYGLLLLPRQIKRDWKPLEERSCTDIPWLIIFVLFCIGMACVCGYPIATGAASRLVSGYDSYGNTCGRNNTKINGVTLSGRDMRLNKYVFFLEPCNLDIINRKVLSIALCVSKCPTVELKDYKDLTQFALKNGEKFLCCSISFRDVHSQAVFTSKTLLCVCSKSISLFNRCIPVDVTCYAEFTQELVTSVFDHDGCHSLHLQSAGVDFDDSGDHWLDRNALDNNSLSIFGKEVVSDNVKALLGCAIVATIFTVILLIVMFILRKRVALTIALFHVAGKVFIKLPLLVVQPLWTLICLMLFWAYWLMVLLFLGVSGAPVKNPSTGVVEYVMEGPPQYLVWYHAVGLIWITEFIFAFQQMTIAGAVVTYYFTRNKSQLPATPILSSVARTILYHLGTLAKGSFIITLVKIPRLILTYIHNQLKGKENACARCLLKGCICCLWCLEKCLKYLNQNAYTATAINSTSFCTSARDALLILVENALRVSAINTVGDFVLFLAKVLVVSCTAFAGVLALNYQKDYTVWVLPLLIVLLFAFLVAHCFLSVFENVVDVLFLCFAVDTKYNDGSPGREFYMDKALMEYVENSKKNKYMAGNEGDQEMKSMSN